MSEFKKSAWAGLDVIQGRRGLEKRLAKGERIEILIKAVIDPDKRAHSDDGTSTQFGLTEIQWKEVSQ